MIEKKRVSRWYFGGIASALAASTTHPLDLLKVQMQTQQEGKVTTLQLATRLVKTYGVTSLYNGISASLLRQLTYSSARFGIYESMKQSLQSSGTHVNFAWMVAMAGFAGAAGGLIGTPADLVNVRMQNDSKLPPEKRRNYKHAIDGLWRVYKHEGFRSLFSGASTASSRAVFMNVGQIAFYDEVKQLLLSTEVFDDSLTTHLLSSLAAGFITTATGNPLDVIKAYQMTSDERMGMIRWTHKLFVEEGIWCFGRGFYPSLVRIMPQTVLTFLFLEYLRVHFGYVKVKKVSYRRKN